MEVVCMAGKGQALEDLVAFTNERYGRSGDARITKVATPTRNIGKRLVYGVKSTVDFSGFVRGGKCIVFDAKETKLSKLKMALLHQHQVDYLHSANRYGAIGFFLVWLTTVDRMFLVFPTDYWVDRYWSTRKSMSLDDLVRDGFEIVGWRKTIPLMNYLPIALEYASCR